MTRPRYEDDPKLCNLVQCCMKKRWNYTESKAFLKQNGYTLLEKQFSKNCIVRIQKKSPSSNQIPFFSEHYVPGWLVNLF